ncbi:hypothetical protein [Paenibacillus sp.]|nr:hypothetical protein [Paenibacillus sp.]MDR0268399.1 hypothetical protein [Paenibacillus sp.]
MSEQELREAMEGRVFPWSRGIFRLTSFQAPGSYLPYSIVAAAMLIAI